MRPVSKRLWIKPVLFVLLLIGVDRGLSVFLANAFERVELGDAAALVNRARRVRADVVILGSSRAQRHYDPRILEEALHRSVYNAGCDGQFMPYTRGVTDLLLRDYAPKLMIVDVDPVMILHSQTYYDRIASLGPFVAESPVIREMIYRRGPLEPLKYALASFRYNSKILAMLSYPWARDRTIDGFLPLDGAMAPRGDADVGNAGPRKPQPEPQADAYLVELLRQSIRAARAADTKVVLVASPRWTSDGRNDPRTANLLAMFPEIAREEDVRYLAFTQDDTPAFRDPSLFADAAHLNRRGAELFTRLLGERLREYGYAPSPGPLAGH